MKECRATERKDSRERREKTVRSLGIIGNSWERRLAPRSPHTRSECVREAFAIRLQNRSVRDRNDRFSRSFLDEPMCNSRLGNSFLDKFSIHGSNSDFATSRDYSDSFPDSRCETHVSSLDARLGISSPRTSRRAKANDSRFAINRGKTRDFNAEQKSTLVVSR